MRGRTQYGSVSDTESYPIHCRMRTDERRADVQCRHVSQRGL
ncbi:hypothetical protein PACID_01940 [Acidipropionibacterium acidipropionici ATCC 4875]|uniref:Uncharacterized protein n=1 Tax=Acidipropionibacterium acidipropionici (strain ATCC 4875 / DSM 20272 / JCM 6432 / NBRC 12425 / NCIMB 8070 / 4) TaxID=1171373 RepID=K7RJG4_ACIA4|nr:hypothetical protein PACID_01940 [Acidipropionibacterium acidipropionici ATCC 4875]